LTAGRKGELEFGNPRTNNQPKTHSEQKKDLKEARNVSDSGEQT